MNIINFSDDVEWCDFTAKNYASFPYVVTHEIGHAIGMEHSSNDAAIMYPTSHSFPTLSPFEDLSIDDAVGARYLYQQPAADLSPDSPMGNR
jgi:predicted Zn-dependent protease